MVTIESDGGTIVPTSAWFENAFFRNTDWPALLINGIVLALAITGVVQALAANRAAKATDRRLFAENQFRPYSDALIRPKADLDSVAALARGLDLPLLDARRFGEDIDNLGIMLFESSRLLTKKLANIDEVERYGGGWEDSFVKHRGIAEEAYDVANDAENPLDRRKEAAKVLSASLVDGLKAVEDHEFLRRQGFGSQR